MRARRPAAAASSTAAARSGSGPDSAGWRCPSRAWLRGRARRRRGPARCGAARRRRAPLASVDPFVDEALAQLAARLAGHLLEAAHDLVLELRLRSSSRWRRVASKPLSPCSRSATPRRARSRALLRRRTRSRAAPARPRVAASSRSSLCASSCARARASSTFSLRFGRGRADGGVRFGARGRADCLRPRPTAPPRSCAACSFCRAHRPANAPPPSDSAAHYIKEEHVLQSLQSATA